VRANGDGERAHYSPKVRSRR